MRIRDFKKRVKELFYKGNIGSSVSTILTSELMASPKDNPLINRLCFVKFHENIDVGGKDEPSLTIDNLFKLPFLGVIRDFKRTVYTKTDDTGLSHEEVVYYALVEKEYVQGFPLPPITKIINLRESYRQVETDEDFENPDNIMAFSYTTWVPLKHIKIFSPSIELLGKNTGMVYGSVLEVYRRMDLINTAKSITYDIRNTFGKVVHDFLFSTKVVYIIVDDIGKENIISQAPSSTVEKRYYDVKIGSTSLKTITLTPPMGLPDLYLKDIKQFKNILNIY